MVKNLPKNLKKLFLELLKQLNKGLPSIFEGPATIQGDVLNLLKIFVAKGGWRSNSINFKELGASLKQVLQKVHHEELQSDKKNSGNRPSAHFALPQILHVLFKFMLNCEDFATREQIWRDLQKLLED